MAANEINANREGKKEHLGDKGKCRYVIIVTESRINPKINSSSLGQASTGWPLPHSGRNETKGVGRRDDSNEVFTRKTAVESHED